MIQYAEDPESCRSVLLASYFGDTESKECNICDNCVAKRKKKDINITSFESVVNMLRASASDAGIDLKILMERFSQDDKEQIMEVIRHLAEEKKLTMNENGRIYFA